MTTETEGPPSPQPREGIWGEALFGGFLFAVVSAFLGTRGEEGRLERLVSWSVVGQALVYAFVLGFVKELRAEWTKPRAQP